jgi:hypothetical protein
MRPKAAPTAANIENPFLPLNAGSGAIITQPRRLQTFRRAENASLFAVRFDNLAGAENLFASKLT